MKKRVAVIDLGTNTFNLLIADVTENLDGKMEFSTVFATKEGVAIGMGGIQEKRITPDAQARALLTLTAFKKHCDAFDVIEINAFGTSAIRDAKNSSQFVEKVKKQLGFQINIISGEEEAALIYKGVCWSYDFQEAAVIMDIGGGSTEFIWANATGIVKKISLNIGVSRAFQQFSFSDPLSNEDIQTLENWFETNDQHFFDDFTCPILIGASGSFETFFEMMHKIPYPNEIKANELNFQELHNTLDWIIQSTQLERDAHPFIISIRRKMAPIAAVKTKWVLKKLEASRVFVSPCSLKEGALVGI